MYFSVLLRLTVAFEVLCYAGIADVHPGVDVMLTHPQRSLVMDGSRKEEDEI